MAQDLSTVLQWRLGLTFVAVTALCQIVVLFRNAQFAASEFGWAFLVIYSTAATAYIILPWIKDYLDDLAHSGAVRMVLLAFCLWVSTEETLHAAGGFHAPQGVTKVAALLGAGDWAPAIAITFTALVFIVVCEVMHALHHCGMCLVLKVHRAGISKNTQL